jgi:hypothetical protein
MTSTNTATHTYSTADVETVMRKVCADLIMIASSTDAIDEAEARKYAHDIEVLTKFGCLKYVDLTLFDDDVEKKAARYNISSDAGSLDGSRPGGVLWPRYSKPSFRIVIGYTDAYTASMKAELDGKLNINWVTSTDDTSHPSLTSNGSRNYTSNAFGMQRKDFGE